MAGLPSVKHCYKGPETARFHSIVLSSASAKRFVEMLKTFLRGESLSSSKAMTATFVVGNIYYGSLAVAHCAFPVVCTKRTEKSAWFEHANSEAYKPARAKIHKWSDGAESSTFHGWRIYADSIKNNGWDMQLV